MLMIVRGYVGQFLAVGAAVFVSALGVSADFWAPAPGAAGFGASAEAFGGVTGGVTAGVPAFAASAVLPASVFGVSPGLTAGAVDGVAA